MVCRYNQNPILIQFCVYFTSCLVSIIVPKKAIKISHALTRFHYNLYKNPIVLQAHVYLTLRPNQWFPS